MAYEQKDNTKHKINSIVDKIITKYYLQETTRMSSGHIMKLSRMNFYRRNKYIVFSINYSPLKYETKQKLARIKIKVFIRVHFI